MATRRGLILGLVSLGIANATLAAPYDYRGYVVAAGLFLLAYVYAQLTRPRDRI